jgi:hypothetical protein
MKGSAKLTQGIAAISEPDTSRDEEGIGDTAPRVRKCAGGDNGLFFMIENPCETLAMTSVNGIWPKDLGNEDKRAIWCNLDFVEITCFILDNFNEVRSGPDNVPLSYRHTCLKESNEMAICLHLSLNKWKSNRVIDIHAEVDLPNRLDMSMKLLSIASGVPCLRSSWGIEAFVENFANQGMK